MHTQQEPVVNAWYTNLTGQLFKVRAVAYNQSGLSSVVVSYLDGTRQIISRQEWLCLKLMKHAVSQARTRRPSTEHIN
jgi:hypothetical protein